MRSSHVSHALFVIAACLCACATANDDTLISFGDGADHTFKELNDPVMGGRSTGTWSVDSSGTFGIFQGEVVDVPSLKAPGFIKAATDGTFPDVSSTLGGNVLLSVRTSTPTYKGFRVSFAAGTIAPSYSCAGGGSIPFSRGCFKAKFSVPAGSDFTTVKLPLTAFSDMWSPATGEHTKECSADPSVCLTKKSLQGIKRVEIWAEGVAGKVHLEVQSIKLQPKGTSMVSPLALIESAVRPPPKFDTCKTAVQPALRYNISSRMNENPYINTGNESIAEAVCCDSRMKHFAETQFLFEAPDIALFSTLEKTSGVTTFYDSACGVPVFKAPVNRTLAEFKADTMEHGWPSFRDGEVVLDNVVTDKSTGFVTSKCGTHLGSYLPDSKGIPRWCIDLSCISGNKA